MNHTVILLSGEKVLAQIQGALHDIAQLQLECQALEAENINDTDSGGAPSLQPQENGFKQEPQAS